MSKRSLYHKLKGGEATPIQNHLGVCLLKPLPQRGGLKLPRVWWQSWVWPCLMAVTAQCSLWTGSGWCQPGPVSRPGPLSTLHSVPASLSPPATHNHISLSGLHLCLVSNLNFWGPTMMRPMISQLYVILTNFIRHLNLSYQRQKVSWVELSW